LKIECPFDLETIFTLTYETEGLKGVIKWIIDNMGSMRGDITGLDSLLKSKVATIDKNAAGVEKNADDIEELRRMIKELEMKSTEDENRVRDMNVTVENLTMNLSMNHRTVMGLQEDHKDLIDGHTSKMDVHQRHIDELLNRAPMVLPEIKGDGIDMGELMKIFATKTPPDNTIKRIEELEAMMADMNDRLKNRPVAAGEPLVQVQKGEAA